MLAAAGNSDLHLGRVERVHLTAIRNRRRRRRVAHNHAYLHASRTSETQNKTTSDYELILPASVARFVVSVNVVCWDVALARCHKISK